MIRQQMPMIKSNTPKGAAQDANQRDAGLYSGEKTGGIPGKYKRRLRTLVPIIGALLQSHLARRNDRHLCQREKSVGQDKQDQDDDFSCGGFHVRLAGCQNKRVFDFIIGIRRRIIGTDLESGYFLCGLAEPFHHGAHREHRENRLRSFVDSVFSVVIKYVAHSFSHSPDLGSVEHAKHVILRSLTTVRSDSERLPV